MKSSEKIIRGIFNPSLPFRILWKKIPFGSFPLRLKFDAVEKPQYAFGIYHSAKLAVSLGIPKISVIEFGVAQGGGLLAMERLAKEVEKTLPIKIEIYGFDTGKGLTAPTDYRDLPYLWREGNFEMDFGALSQKLTKAKLIIGDVKTTVKNFWGPATAPIGFISFDLDLYSSTKHALSLIDAEASHFLPRVLCYFDDILDEEAVPLFNENTGELLAVKEFNDSHSTIKISRVNGLSAKRYFKSAWPEAMYALHFFNHERYNDPVING